MVRLYKEEPPKKSFKDKVLANHIVHHLIEFFSKVSKDKLTAFSSEAALFTIMSFFPFLMLFFVILSFTDITPAFIYRLIQNSFPTEIINLVMTVQMQLSSTSTTVIIITAATTIWSASRGFIAIIRGLDVVYGAESNKNPILYRIHAFIYPIGFAVLLFLTLVLLGFGNSIYTTIIKHFPFVKDLALLVMGMRVTVILSLLFFFFLIMYLVLPNRKSSLIYEIPGALLSALGWVGFSYGFAFYIDHIANFSYVYGSLTAIMLLLLWVYWCMFILFLGAEVNVYLYNYIHSKLKSKGSNSRILKAYNFINSHKISFKKRNKSYQYDYTEDTHLTEELSLAYDIDSQTTDNYSNRAFMSEDELEDATDNATDVEYNLEITDNDYTPSYKNKNSKKTN